MALDGKRVIVIGGRSGIGQAVAALAGAQGATVIIGSRSTDQRVDLRDENSVARFFGEVGAFHHLVVTAGDWDVPMRVAVRDLDLSQARANLAVRFWGALAAVKHGCHTIAHDGSITLTSGMLVHRPMKGAPLATAVGGAIEHLARGLAFDLAPVRVNAVCPGVVLTEHVVQQMPEAMVQAFVAPLPVPRAATPAEAAQAYLYAMLNGYVTGQILPVDGGGLLV